MTSTRKYTMTVRQVLHNLGILTDAYEKMSAGARGFAINATDAAATLKAAHQLISLVPVWIPVSEQLPEDGQNVIAYFTGGGEVGEATFNKRDVWFYNEHGAWAATHWMPLPEPPEADATPVVETTRGEGSVHGEGSVK